MTRTAVLCGSEFGRKLFSMKNASGTLMSISQNYSGENVSFDFGSMQNQSLRSLFGFWRRNNLRSWRRILQFSITICNGEEGNWPEPTLGCPSQVQREPPHPGHHNQSLHPLLEHKHQGIVGKLQNQRGANRQENCNVQRWLFCKFLGRFSNFIFLIPSQLNGKLDSIVSRRSSNFAGQELRIMIAGQPPYMNIGLYFTVAYVDAFPFLVNGIS